jgi:hypothetical protein
MPRPFVPSRPSSLTSAGSTAPTPDTSAPACARCRERLDTLTREAAAVPLTTGVHSVPFPDREKFDPMLGAWFFVGADEREALIDHVMLFVHKSAAPRVVAPVRPALRVLPGGRARRRAGHAGGAR